MASIRVAINGFGRIGRSVFRAAYERDDIEFVGINDVTKNETLAYLLKYDTVMGRFPHPIKITGSLLEAGKQKTQMLTESDPSSLPWKELGVDVVIESTGRFRSRAEIEKHLVAGSQKVILCVPPKDSLDAMVVLGVNDDVLQKNQRLISNASCTTNCLGPVVKILHEKFGIRNGFMTTVHAYTNDQRLGDFPHKDLRRARAANENIIATTTGAARAVGKVLPELAGRLDGSSMRVPIPDGSVVDLMVLLEKKTNTDEINQEFEREANGRLKGILEYSSDPIVSSDIIGNPHSAIFDAPLTQVLDGNFAKVIAWYDNEWGYSNRVVDLVSRIGSS